MDTKTDTGEMPSSEQPIPEEQPAQQTKQPVAAEVKAEYEGFYVSGWRPAVGWICAAALAYDFLLRNLLPWLVVVLFGAQVPPMPAVDIESLCALVVVMLGYGGIQTFEKYKKRGPQG